VGDVKRSLLCLVLLAPVLELLNDTLKMLEWCYMVVVGVIGMVTCKFVDEGDSFHFDGVVPKFGRESMTLLGIVFFALPENGLANIGILERSFDGEETADSANEFECGEFPVGVWCVVVTEYFFALEYSHLDCGVDLLTFDNGVEMCEAVCGLGDGARGEFDHGSHVDG
jgi:hypothetical protein